ncbi:ribosomal protein S18 acetylase RimI-like enzyme [Halarchaeum rubridurum]|uniref:GNAT family N-acetyltransferase n=1 Tax=Halarchaeum rubridurum TaxID=489911 RepID=A0A830FXR7_9EURY|nr:GNAT family N-acetyltransferase [Halarchaeum rubridurum]MBP1954555.1 ribosomal protein S18 acetylase RimI-like enzyme [Halarchaeum rubridurum]GGM62007.1 GNAT family N-acetyltransferase [Halarchaeum rubridurum]
MSKSASESEIGTNSSTNGGVHVAAVTDGAGRQLDITGYRGVLPDGTANALAGMYGTFGFEDRAQGLPPMGLDAVRSWLERLGDSGARHVLVEHDDVPVAHAVLVPDGDAHELAIFVQPEYQGARVGTHTMEALFDYGRERGVETVWLHVEKSNAPAVSLYQGYDFEITDERPLEFEMVRDL